MMNMSSAGDLLRPRPGIGEYSDFLGFMCRFAQIRLCFGTRWADFLYPPSGAWSGSVSCLVEEYGYFVESLWRVVLSVRPECGRGNVGLVGVVSKERVDPQRGTGVDIPSFLVCCSTLLGMDLAPSELFDVPSLYVI